MTHNLDLILTLTGGLSAGLVFGYFTERMRLSPIVGYLLAGIAVGPFTPGFVASSNLAGQLSEVGVILLMFGVGLHFNLRELYAVRGIAIPGAVIQSAGAAALGIAITYAFHWPISAGVVFGTAISVASTVVLTRVLADNHELHTPVGHIAVGWLLVEDVLTVVALVVLPIVANPAPTAHGAGELAASLGIAMLKIAALCVFTLVVGMRVIPKLLTYVVKSASRELFTLAVLVIALGIAVGSAELFGASMALGAFLAGVVVGQSDFSAQAAAEALPLRDAFAVLFFVAIGMLFDPSQLLDHLPLTLATLAVVMVAKPLIAFVVAVAFRRPVRTAILVATSLGQIGEFSFIVASLGGELGVLPREATQTLVVVAIVTITLNPLLWRAAEPLARRLERKSHASSGPSGLSAVADHVMIVGHGPVGRHILQLLIENSLVPTVIDLNLDTVRELRARGVRAIYGDAAYREVLEAAGIQTARGLIFSSNATPFATVQSAMALNPNLAVLTRTAYLRDADALRAMGATVVVAESEVALAMTEILLARLQATAEQLAQARDRLRAIGIPSP